MNLRLLFFLLLHFAFLSQVMGEQEFVNWIVYYSDKASIRSFDPYSLIVLDSVDHPSISALKERNKKLFGYINLGEVSNDHSWFKEVKKEGILQEENPRFPGSYFVDFRNPLWEKRVIERIIPWILHKGFDGLFLDTLDNASYLENKDPRKYAGMKQAASKLVQSIHHQYPQIPIILNRGYDLLPKIGGSINMILAEDLTTTYDFKKKKYLMLSKDQVQAQVKILQQLKKDYPNLILLALDYWYPEQKETIKKIYAKDRQLGFSPYVGTIDLNIVVPEPKE